MTFAELLRMQQTPGRNNEMLYSPFLYQMRYLYIFLLHTVYYLDDEKLIITESGRL